MTTEFASLSQRPSVTSVAAPKWPVVALGAVAGLAVVAIWLGSASLWMAVCGYVLGALVAPSVTVIYRFARRSAAKSPFFIPNRQLERLVLILLVLAVLAGVINAWFVATELAKQ
jgi:hypothetical protein